MNGESSPSLLSETLAGMRSRNVGVLAESFTFSESSQGIKDTGTGVEL
jgi:hypothetical protein